MMFPIYNFIPKTVSMNVSGCNEACENCITEKCFFAEISENCI